MTAQPLMQPRQAVMLDMALPGQTHDKRSAKPAKRASWRAIRKWSFRTAAVSCVLLLALGAVLFGKGYLKLHKVFQGGSSAAALQANVDPSLLKGEGDGRINVLLMGIGGAGHDAPDLTDTMVLASIDPVNHRAALLSIPRDMWVEVTGHGPMKINAAYETGKYKYLGREDLSNSNHQAVQAGFDLTDQTVEQVLGVPVHYNVLVNFQAFRQAIDTVGGVSINVPEQLYDPTMAWENHGNPVLAAAGQQTFDGTHALLYVRSRETSSDFARSQRQRAVMLALKDKVLTAGTLSNPLKISNLLSAFGDNVQSDISVSDVGRLGAIATKVANNSIQSIGLADPPNNYVTTADIGGQSVVEPRAGLTDYSAIQNYVRGIFKDGYIARENANITVLNGTVTPGLATKKADDLKSYGYNVGTVDNAPTTDYAKTTIVDLSKGTDKYTLHYLQNRYSAAVTTQQLPAGIQQGKANIVIILGQDETLSN